jgi:nucleoside-diphosphate-sugar epimerase
MLLIFGATGFIGRALQASLRADRMPYVGFGRTAVVRSDGITFADETVSEPAERAALLSGLPKPDAIVFAAGTAVTGTDAGALETSHFASLVEAFAAMPPGWLKGLPFVYASSSIVYETPPFPRRLSATDAVAPSSAYAAIKLRCERFVVENFAAAGARAAIARLFNVSGFGHRVGIVAEIAGQAVDIQSGRRNEFKLRTNEPILDLIDVDEAAAALLALAQTPGQSEVVNVCSGRPVTTEDLIAAARRAIGSRAQVRYALETDRRQMRVGDPKPMTERTGWYARRDANEIVAAAISGLQAVGGP